MPFGISSAELMILLARLLLVFGAKRLPEMGRSLGKGMREFKDSVQRHRGDRLDDDSDDTPTPTRVELPSATSAPDAPPASPKRGPSGKPSARSLPSAPQVAPAPSRPR